ncbi:hypothetical protein [Halomicronema hongdechloris]|uniref:hypothetical protein n=1 Tax=Halomicronema hongdechloris TaxID=1209493 RepID=UPI0016510E66|nr:hypothetical protein [Halomicronema hongdechloris]
MMVAFPVVVVTAEPEADPVLTPTASWKPPTATTSAGMNQIAPRGYSGSDICHP